MEITITIADGKAARLVDGICAATGWTAASGIAAEQWAKDAIIKTMRETAKRGLMRQQMAVTTEMIDGVVIT